MVDSSARMPIAGGVSVAGDSVRGSHHANDHQGHGGRYEEVVVEVGVDQAPCREHLAQVQVDDIDVFQEGVIYVRIYHVRHHGEL